MDRPLWQMILSFFLVAFAVHRGAAAAMAWLGEAHPALFLAFAAETLAALATAVGLWFGRRWVIFALVVLGIAIAATAILESVVIGAAAIPYAAARVLVAALGTGALAMVLRHELRGEPERPRP